MNPDLENKIRQYTGGAHKMVASLATIDVMAGTIPEIRTITLMECDWRFFFATNRDSRKAKELSTCPKAAALVHLRDEKYSGYLRLTGTIQVIEDIKSRREVAETSQYPIDHHWKGFDDPNLWLARIVPDRVEFIAPGEDVATDITAEFPQ